MGKIKITYRNQGKGIYKCDDEQWEYFLKIDGADIKEYDEKITIITEDETEIIADKSYPYSNNSKFITYTIRLDYGGGLQILLSKYKSDDYTFELKGFYADGFKLGFEGNSEYDDLALNDPSFNPVFTKKIFLSNQELPLLFQGYMKSLFVKPERGYLLFESGKNGGNLYFDKDYYIEFVENLHKHYSTGKFAESNAEAEWMNFMRKIKNAEDVRNPDVTEFKIYSA